MHYVSVIIEILLVGYIVRDAARAQSLYRQLKQATANGDAGARSRMYREILAFEWISAVLALGALGFDWSKLTPRSLVLADSLWMPQLANHPEFFRGVGREDHRRAGNGTSWCVLLRALYRDRIVAATDHPARAH
ncbi:MAG TPA: hypothetical protein VNZ06_04485 [Steroidobacteraceae bacterium]|jgi:hypothetical protein|nr:hypothetical protein [Steroidobacteraceae bacterium]